MSERLTFTRRPSLGSTLLNWQLAISNWKFQTSDLFRISDFGFRISIALVLLAIGVSSTCVRAQPTNPPPSRIDFSNFRIITERNIFSPRRVSKSASQAAPAAKIETVTLVGTMSYEKGPFAFFDGTSSNYRKVAKVDDVIAGYKVTNIAYNAVNLANGTNELQLAVGMQLRREEDGPWQLAAITSPGTGSETSTNESPGSSSETASSSTGSDDPVLKRLMQRREQEMNR